jgi:Fe-S cluster biogenesis protein NfuA
VALPFISICRPTRQAAPAIYHVARNVHQSTRLPAIAASNARNRPTLHPLHQPSNLLKPAAVGGTRSIFIQTEPTPNEHALKFLPGITVLPKDFNSAFVEYSNPRATISPPHPSPLAASLMNVDGVARVFYGTDFITVTKREDAQWPHVKPEVFALITEAVTSGAPMVNIVGDQAGQVDSLSYDENDPEVVGMIKELLETRIRPAIQDDGGDIDYCGFEDGQVLVKLRGSCDGCASSAVTLKNGIEGMLMHYVRFDSLLNKESADLLQIEEVKGVTQVLDEAEKVSELEFAKFEEKLLNGRKVSDEKQQENLGA